MTTSSHQWGGTRRNSGRPRGGVRDARRKINAALFQDGVDSCAHVIAELVLDGRGSDVLKILQENFSVYAEYQENKQES